MKLDAQILRHQNVLMTFILWNCKIKLKCYSAQILCLIKSIWRLSVQWLINSERCYFIEICGNCSVYGILSKIWCVVYLILVNKNKKIKRFLIVSIDFVHHSVYWVIIGSDAHRKYNRKSVQLQPYLVFWLQHFTVTWSLCIEWGEKYMRTELIHIVVVLLSLI